MIHIEFDAVSAEDGKTYKISLQPGYYAFDDHGHLGCFYDPKSQKIVFLMNAHMPKAWNTFAGYVNHLTQNRFGNAGTLASLGAKIGSRYGIIGTGTAAIAGAIAGFAAKDVVKKLTFLSEPGYYRELSPVPVMQYTNAIHYNDCKLFK